MAGGMSGKRAETWRVQWEPLGDAAIVVRFGEEIDPLVHSRVRSLSRQLEERPLPGMIEYVPAFATVTVFYDPVRVREAYAGEAAGTGFSGDRGGMPYDLVRRALEELIGAPAKQAEELRRTVEIPVCYGGEFGPDLEEVARHNGLTPEEVIQIHAGGEYLVYMIGFAPGFPYLGGMSERIATPRRSTPRLAIPAGSVGIAGTQTGVYPIETPGGWQLIGRTPLALFRPDREPPSLLMAGDVVRFRPISRGEFDRWKEGDECG